MQTSKLSRRGQVTLPERSARRQVWDRGTSSCEVRDGVILLKRLEPLDAEFHQALSGTLDEWASPEDEEAFRDL